MDKCLVRERIDVDGVAGRVSYMHKVWEDGLIQYFAIRDMPDPVDERPFGEAEWLELCKTHEPQATYANSDWGSGLPGAGDIWKDIPAWERGI